MLTEVQKQALEQIKKDAQKDSENGQYFFAEVFNEVSRRNFTQATLQALVKAGVIAVKHSFVSSYTVRGQFGRGIRYTRTQNDVLYVFAI